MAKTLILIFALVLLVCTASAFYSYGYRPYVGYGYGSYGYGYRPVYGYQYPLYGAYYPTYSYPLYGGVLLKK